MTQENKKSKSDFIEKLKSEQTQKDSSSKDNESKKEKEIEKENKDIQKKEKEKDNDSKPKSEKRKESYLDDIFRESEYRNDEHVSINVSINLRNKLKIYAAAMNAKLSDVYDNILDDFIKKNKNELNKKIEV